MELTHEDVQRIVKIIDEAEHLEELELVYGDLRLHVRRQGSGGRPIQLSPPQALTDSARPAAPPPAAKGRTASRPVPEGMVAIKAPMLGTFYRSSAPGEPPFAEIGQQVKADDTVCLIEVMKLFNSIQAGVAGRIAEIRADNASLVEYGETLIVIEPEKR